MMSIGLHLRMIGRPGRIAALDRIVAHMKSKGGAWFATRRQIAEHWIRRDSLVVLTHRLPICRRSGMKLVAA